MSDCICGTAVRGAQHKGTEEKNRAKWKKSNLGMNNEELKNQRDE